MQRIVLYSLDMATQPLEIPLEPGSIRVKVTDINRLNRPVMKKLLDAGTIFVLAVEKDDVAMILGADFHRHLIHQLPTAALFPIRALPPELLAPLKRKPYVPKRKKRKKKPETLAEIFAAEPEPEPKPVEPTPVIDWSKEDVPWA